MWLYTPRIHVTSAHGDLCPVISFPGRALQQLMGGGPGVVVSNAAFHARVRGSFLGIGGLKETKMFLPHPLVFWGGSVTER